jgi:hypothetical protein
MTSLVIILILIGSGILIFSCFLVDKSNQDSEIYSNLVNQKELTIAEIEDIKKKVETIVSEITENSIEKAEDKLSQLSNEKIIAVNEFSNQVIEKISQNHEEVIFLYNMLNEKEVDLKEILKNIDNVKKQVKEIDTKEPVASVSKTKGKNQTMQISNKENKVVENVENLKQDFFNNNNKKILELYSQGFSVIDIAKTLELGQGEVKLVIDLYNEK